MHICMYVYLCILCDVSKFVCPCTLLGRRKEGGRKDKIIGIGITYLFPCLKIIQARKTP